MGRTIERDHDDEDGGGYESGYVPSVQVSIPSERDGVWEQFEHSRLAARDCAVYEVAGAHDELWTLRTDL